MLEAALAYAALGWRVFPLLPKSKEPATVHGFKDATTDEGQIRRWWAENPERNVGIATGRGLCVVDVDDKPKNPVQGSDMLRDWELEHGDLTPTVTATTGTGGVHYYYDVGRKAVPSCQSDTVFIDLRCEGGYVVAPPSVHPNGEPYAWDASPEDMPPAKVSETDKSFIQWVYDNRKGAGKEGQRERAKVPEGVVHEGEGRNRFLYEQGCSARAKGSDDEMIEIWLTELNRAKCSPPLGERELMKVVGSVCSKPVGLSDEAKAAKVGRPRKFEHNKVARRLIDERGACLLDGETPAVRENGGRYRTGWGAFDAAIIDMHDDCTRQNRNEVKSYIAAKAPARRQSSPYLIAFKNGVLDVRDMVLRDWEEGDVIPNVIPHDWNTGARSDLLDRTLERMACGSVEVQMNLLEFLGACMLRSVKLCPFFPVLVGVGSNGKSTYIELIKNVVGDENISGMQPKEIAAHFMGEHIVGKTANLGDDIASGFLDDKDCAVIKSVATGDLMFTDVKGGSGYNFQPYCTMVFSCNQFPRLADTTPGFMRRLFPVEFNATFTRDDPDYDPMIGERLRDEECLEYACALGVEGIRRIIAQNGPTPNDMAESMRSEIAREGNTGLQWLNDDGVSVTDVLGKTKEEVHAAYIDWCDRNGYRRTAMGSAHLSALLGTYFRVSCTKTAHRESLGKRRTVKVYELKQ